ncbi:GHKL domain-containing protein [candidate division GN15 bacterium]|nr:GHKL domain-containing protein [candidate division GN15 bacterium]
MSTRTEQMPLSAAARSQMVDKQILALDALAKMTRQFATRPDFAHLVEVLLLTISGQFSVTSAFVLLRNPRSNQPERSFYGGAGRFKKHGDLANLGGSSAVTSFLESGDGACRVRDMDTSGDLVRLKEVLTRTKVEVIAPLYHGDSLSGILGLGGKVAGKPYEDVELSLLSMLAGTISPMLASSYLFLEIARLNEWYLDILDNVKQGVFVFDDNDRLTKINTAGRLILKHLRTPLHEADEQDAPELSTVFVDDVFPGWAARLIRSRSLPSGRVTEALVASGKDAERIFTVNATVIKREDSSDLVVTLDDITEQKETDQRMFNLEKFADKGVMASSISHELNNFLGLILGGIEISQMNLARGKNEKVEATLEKLRANVDKMERFTAGLMDYTRLDTKKSEADLNTVISEVLSFVAIQKKFKKIAIQVYPDNTLPSFPMDTDQIAQLLLNFCNNAADAIAEACRSNGEISFRTSHDDEAVVLTVSDNGTGIPPEVEERLFKTHLTTKEGGHGYGLVTCAKIIRNHGAEVSIDTRVGHGTTFTVRFPLNPESPDQPAPRQE